MLALLAAVHYATERGNLHHRTSRSHQQPWEGSSPRSAKSCSSVVAVVLSLSSARAQYDEPTQPYSRVFSPVAPSLIGQSSAIPRATRLCSFLGSPAIFQ